MMYSNYIIIINFIPGKKLGGKHFRMFPRPRGWFITFFYNFPDFILIREKTMCDVEFIFWTNWKFRHFLKNYFPIIFEKWTKKFLVFYRNLNWWCFRNFCWDLCGGKKEFALKRYQQNLLVLDFSSFTPIDTSICRFCDFWIIKFSFRPTRQTPNTGNPQKLLYHNPSNANFSRLIKKPQNINFFLI